MTRRYTVFAIIFGILFGTITFPARAFRDVSDEWFAPHVQRLIAADAIDETRQFFEPNRTVTRAEFVKMLVKAFRFQLIAPEIPTYRDVSRTAWFYTFVETAKQNLIIDQKEKFHPHDTVNRAQAVTMITRALNIPQNFVAQISFSDVPENAWFRPTVASAFIRGIVRGYDDGTFRPENPVNRAETAAFISRAIDSRRTPTQAETPQNESQPFPPVNEQPNAQETPTASVNIIATDTNTDPIPTGGMLTSLISLVITNTSADELFLQHVNIRKVGIFAEEHIDGIAVLDDNDFMRGNRAQFSEGIATVNTAHDPVAIGAWDTTRIKLAVIFKRGAGSGSLSFKIETKNDIVLKNKEGVAADLSGPFPLGGQPQAVFASQNLAELKFTPLEVPRVGPDLFVEQGQLNMFISRFGITDQNNADDIELLRITLTNSGSARDDQFTNFRLLDRNNTVIAGNTKMIDGKIRFFIQMPAGSPNRGKYGGYLLRKGTDRELKVVTDVAPQSAIEERVLDLGIEKPYDIQAIGLLSATGVPLAESEFPIRHQENVLTVRAGTFAITKANQSLQGSVAIGASNIPLVTFDIEPTSEALEMKALQIAILRTVQEPLRSGTKIPRGSIRILDAAGNQLAVIDASDERLYGANTEAFSIVDGLLTGSPNGTGLLVQFGQSYEIDPDQANRIQIVINISEHATRQEKYTAIIQGYRILRGASQTPTEIQGTIDQTIATGNTISIR